MPKATRNSIADGASTGGLVSRGQLAGEVGHVERAGDAVEQADARSGTAPTAIRFSVDVLDPAVELRALAAEHQQAERGDQHHLEPDVQVEEVAGQEGAADAQQLDVERG